eukprot:scaffold10070_cov115-Skeletonema_marinoi.AAC.3
MASEVDTDSSNPTWRGMDFLCDPNRCSKRMRFWGALKQIDTALQRRGVDLVSVRGNLTVAKYSCGLSWYVRARVALAAGSRPKFGLIRSSTTLQRRRYDQQVLEP